MSNGTTTVFEVLWCDQSHRGPACDGTYVERFRKRDDAERFASGRRDLYGNVAHVVEVKVSRRLAKRWGL